MRVTNRAATRNYLRYVNKGLSDQAKVQERVASGNRFEKVSDDVSSGIQAMKAKTEQYKMEKQIGNIEDINNVLVAAEDSMMTINEQLSNVHTRLLRAINDPNTNNRNILALEIKALKEEILQMANSQYNGQFLFSASNNYEPPFSVDKETGKITYNGVGVPADEIFRREDGTYYYLADESIDPNSPFKVVPLKDETTGKYQLEEGTRTTPATYKAPTSYAVGNVLNNPTYPHGGTHPAIVDNGTTVAMLDIAGNNDFYTDANNNLYLKDSSGQNVYKTVASALPAGSTLVTPPISNVATYQDSKGLQYVQYNGQYYQLEAQPDTLEPNYLEFTIDNPPTTVIDSATGAPVTGNKGTNLKLISGTADTAGAIYEADDGTLYQFARLGANPGDPAVYNRVENKKDAQGNEVTEQEKIRTYKDVPLNERIYLDVGLGIRMTGSTVDPQTAFEVTYVGPDVMGFGIDEKTGISNNLYNLLTDIEKVVNETPFATDTARELGAHLLTRMDAFRENITDIGAKTQFLETMLDRLNKSRDNLEISIGNYTGTDYVEESRHQASASAVINALYQLGSNIIPLSLMDFVS